MEQFFNPGDLAQSAPLLLLLVAGLVCMLADAFDAGRALPWIAGFGLGASAVLAWPGVGGTPDAALHYSGMVIFGGAFGLIHAFLCVSALFTLFFIEDFLRRHHQWIGEAYALLLFAVVGMAMLACANNLIVTFIGLEVMSVCLYIMAGMFKREKRSNEAGLKYFLLGAFATGFLLYGIALIYGISGTTQLDLLRRANPQFDTLFFPALALLLIGFFFKIAAFPFHSWTPDVYTGTPTPFAGFMATGSKMAAFVALSLILVRLLPYGDDRTMNLLWVLAAASMIYGNIVAARQTNIKRLLAFSSIAHTGYLLMGVLSKAEGLQAVLFYMFVYTLMTLGAFGVISIVERGPADARLDAWRGLGYRRPWLAVLMSLFLLSLAGIPPLAGFMSKYQIFYAAIKANYIGLAIVGVLTSVVGAYYYLRVMVYMYFLKPLGEPQEEDAHTHADAQGHGEAHAGLHTHTHALEAGHSPTGVPAFGALAPQAISGGATAVLTAPAPTAASYASEDETADEENDPHNLVGDTAEGPQRAPYLGAWILALLLLALGIYPSLVTAPIEQLYGAYLQASNYLVFPR